MILPILIGTNLFLYLACVYLFKEYMDTLDELDLKEANLLPLPPAARVAIILLWPLFTFVASLAKARP
jgi:hypothetical protein